MNSMKVHHHVNIGMLFKYTLHGQNRWGRHRIEYSIL